MASSLFFATSPDLALIAPAEQLSDLVKQLREQGWHFSVVSQSVECKEFMQAIHHNVCVISMPESYQENEPILKWLESCFAKNEQGKPHALAQQLMVILGSDDMNFRRRVAQLNVGDWMHHPYTREELWWRIQRLRKHLHPHAIPLAMQHPLQIDAESGILRAAQANVSGIYLTAGERAVLTALMQAQGRVVSRQLLARSLGTAHVNGGSSLNTIILRLRCKLQRTGLKTLQLITVPKRGYRLLT